MFGMAGTDPTGGLWNWAVERPMEPDRVRGALAGTLERTVVPLGEDGDTLCDIYEVGGDFPLLVDVYLAPSLVDEATAASAVAVRLDAAVLLPDDTLNPSRYVLATPVRSAGTYARAQAATRSARSAAARRASSRRPGPRPPEVNAYTIG
jgi:hypothetical protein